MAMTTAQRQAAFRERHSTTKARINVLVSNDVREQLTGCARRYNITESAMLERMIKDHEYLHNLLKADVEKHIKT